MAFYSPAALQNPGTSLVSAVPAITSVTGVTGIAFDTNDNIYVPNYNGTWSTKPVSEYQHNPATGTPTGTTPITLSSFYTASVEPQNPEGVAVDPLGNIYVSNAPNNIVDVCGSTPATAQGRNF